MAKGEGILPRKRKDKLAKLQRDIGDSNLIQFGKNTNQKMVSWEHRLRSEGKEKRAFGVALGRISLEAFVPPKHDVGLTGGINRASLYLLGGVKGRKRARELRKEVREKIKWSQRPIVERQVTELVQENNWHHLKPDELNHIVDGLLERRTKTIMLGRAGESTFYWGTIAYMGKEIAGAPLFGARVAGRVGTGVAGREVAEAGFRTAEKGIMEVGLETVGRDIAGHEVGKVVEESVKLSWPARFINNQQKRSMKKWIEKQMNKKPNIRIEQRIE